LSVREPAASQFNVWRINGNLEARPVVFSLQAGPWYDVEQVAYACCKIRDFLGYYFGNYAKN
jgi:hypothetical protein